MRLVLSALFSLSVGLAAAQTSPGPGPVPFPPLSGGQLTTPLFLVPSTPSAAGLNCGAGTAPTSPTDGDVWCTSTGVYAQINGTTVGPLVGGLTLPTGAAGDVPYYTAPGTIGFIAPMTAGLPLVGGGAGSPPATGTRSGNTTKFATVTGTFTANNCVQTDANGNFTDAGAACGGGGGGGSGTVSGGLANQLAFYSASGNTVGGLTLGANILAALQIDENGTGKLAGTTSPALLGTPTAPTQATADTSTDLATDAFAHNVVQAAVPTGLIGQIPYYAAGGYTLSPFTPGANILSALQLDENGTGKLAGTTSPAFLGGPTAPTQSTGDTGTYLATDAFVHNVANALPAINYTTVTSALGFVPYNSSNPSGFIAGVPTTFGAVGTYVVGIGNSYGTSIALGGTVAGSVIVQYATGGVTPQQLLSGTWRCMGAVSNSSPAYYFGLFVRIS